jgi:glycosyltransferase involved in cell wall biosynthesis
VASAEAAPRLSVVIACLDAQDVLGFQLAALARQQCPVPWEVLVCDRGSSDETVALAESWLGRLPLRIIRADGLRGADAARLIGVSAAQGEWIGLCDPHDEVDDGWLTALCAALAEHSFVAGRFETEWVKRSRARRVTRCDPEFGRQRAGEAGALPDAGGGNLGIRRSVFLEAVGSAVGSDPSASPRQVADLFRRVQLSGHSLVSVPDLVVHRRRWAGSRGGFMRGRGRGALLASLELWDADVAQRLPDPTCLAAGDGSGGTVSWGVVHGFDRPLDVVGVGGGAEGGLPSSGAIGKGGEWASPRRMV